MSFLLVITVYAFETVRASDKTVLHQLVEKAGTATHLNKLTDLELTVIRNNPDECRRFHNNVHELQALGLKETMVNTICTSLKYGFVGVTALHLLTAKQPNRPLLVTALTAVAITKGVPFIYELSHQHQKNESNHAIRTSLKFLYKAAAQKHLSDMKEKQSPFVYDPKSKSACFSKNDDTFFNVTSTTTSLPLIIATYDPCLLAELTPSDLQKITQEKVNTLNSLQESMYQRNLYAGVAVSSMGLAKAFAYPAAPLMLLSAAFLSYPCACQKLEQEIERECQLRFTGKGYRLGGEPRTHIVQA